MNKQPIKSRPKKATQAKTEVRLQVSFVAALTCIFAVRCTAVPLARGLIVEKPSKNAVDEDHYQPVSRRMTRALKVQRTRSEELFVK